jgi:hypothetical protein
VEPLTNGSLPKVRVEQWLYIDVAAGFSPFHSLPKSSTFPGHARGQFSLAWFATTDFGDGTTVTVVIPGGV